MKSSFTSYNGTHRAPNPALSRNGSAQRYNPKQPHENVIFWGTPPAERQNIIQRIRTSFWFYPDFIGIIMHGFRPISYLLLFFGIFWGAQHAFIYAQNNPNSALSNSPKQELIEGAVGSVSSLNPLYVTQNQIERDLHALIFNKLISIKPDGNPRPELATTWGVSEDGKEYTFFLRNDVSWHDGERFTSDDVIFTFEAIQQLGDEDSYQREFKDLTFSRIDDYTFTLVLPETNPTLISSLAFPIVPEHILSSMKPQDIRFSSFNQYPVGTGPFIIEDNSDEEIVLRRNEQYFEGAPTIDKITYRFFSDEQEALDALKTFSLHTLTNPTPLSLSEVPEIPSFKAYSFTSLLRQKVIYFNLRHSGPLSYPTVRQALSTATDRESLAKIITPGGTVSLGPISQDSWAFDDAIDRYSYDSERAEKLFANAGWNIPEDSPSGYRTSGGEDLVIKLAYLDSDTNERIAKELQFQWKEAGVKLELDPQSYERISSETVPRRNFEALLFEIECTPDPDKYNFWHSSQIEYPGLNLSGYEYERVDILLERARTDIDKDERTSDYSLFQLYIMNDMPALYLYHPSYAFIAHDSVRGIQLRDAVLPHHRYAHVEKWRIE